MSTTWINRGHFYVPHVRPVLVDCNFIVDAANGNGLGIRSLKGQGVQNVFMHTSTTPGRGPNGVLNPNPAAGIILVQLADNFSRYYGGFSGFVPPVATSTKIDDSALTVGHVYVITTVGNSTLAQWQSIGLMPGITPAVGVAFVATAIGIAGEAGTSTSRVMIPGASGITSIEAIGNSNLSIGPIPQGGSPHVGGWLTFQCMAPTVTSMTNAFEAPMIPTAPASGSGVGLAFYLSQSSVQVSGE